MTIAVVKDMRSAFPLARDQGDRSTCLACATSDAHAAKATSHVPLSVEFAFFHALRILGGNPEDGLTFQAMDLALTRNGQPYESDWPYQLTEPDKISWAPPPTIGKTFHANCSPQPKNVAQVFGHVELLRPVVLGIAIGARFMMPPGDAVFDHIAREQIVGFHAVLGIGWGRPAAAGHSRVMLARNSWGPSWAMNGHAWLTERFLEQNLFAYSVIH
jgi:hypothetical protein